jgi:protein SCO1/2
MSIFKSSLRLHTFAAFLLLSSVPAWAQLADQVPEALQEVGVTEHLGAKLPLDATFTNERGERVSLGQYFDGERPVILTLNYYKCPMLCGLMLNGVVDGLEQLAWSPGDEFEMVTISINPLETPELAAAKKQNYLKRLDRPGAGEGWHFLTGYELDIDRVAEAVGFQHGDHAGRAGHEVPVRNRVSRETTQVRIARGCRRHHRQSS